MSHENGEGVYLTPDELAEFKLRRGILDQARANFMMVEEAYVAWTRTIKERYDLPAQYNIDTGTGKLMSKDA